ncbi:formate/nitrite transporter family protein [Sphingomonas carotinifaciens]|uniref:formate/nitrite transporter family protein n=1 Tax=Sphingomonas carotinifaciens TaxID=1166323 RepID=UPI0039A0A6DA
MIELSDELQDRKDDIDLSENEEEAVDEREAASAQVIHEVVRRHGDEELERPTASLIWSGLAGGIAISTSILGEALLERKLPITEWSSLVASMGYTLGFLIVVLGGLQLFTESTLSAVLPVATHPSRRNIGRLLRLWVLVFIANMAGTMLIACLNNYGLIGAPEHRTAMLTLSRRLLENDFVETVKLAIPAGFLMAAVPWVMPSSKGQQFWVVFVLTYFIAVGGFAHVVAGSGEAWILAFAGETSFTHAAFGMILPALIGNVIGGTGLFALLAHAQVKQEL